MTPPPYTMCTQQEAFDRMDSMEVNILEATTETCRMPIHQRILDVSRAVAKYRRSAAASSRKYTTRNLYQLEATVSWLESILVEQKAADPTLHVPLIDCYQFVADRMRCIQVEMTRARYSSNGLQYRMARMCIYCQYLLNQSPAFITKHHDEAFHTCLLTYWEGSNGSSTSSADDRMLSYYVANHVRQRLLGSDLPLTNGLAMVRKHLGATANIADLPLLRWTLNWTTLIANELWWNAIHKMIICPDVSMRCLLAPVITTLRLLSLKVWNQVVPKNTQFSFLEVQRLLAVDSLENVAEIVTACRLLVVVENEVSYVVFKADVRERPSFETSENKVQTSLETLIIFGKDKYTQGISMAKEPDGTYIPSDETIKRLLIMGSF